MVLVVNVAPKYVLITHPPYVSCNARVDMYGAAITYLESISAVIP